MRNFAKGASLVVVVVVVVVATATGCANQTPVIPLLHVEPNAGARIFYFEKRAAAMFPKKEGAPPAAADADAECEEPPLRTWGAAQTDVEGTACDPGENE